MRQKYIKLYKFVSKDKVQNPDDLMGLALYFYSVLF